MRVVVVGATGNVGTSVLQALAGEPKVESVMGVARRRPKLEAPKTASSVGAYSPGPKDRRVGESWPTDGVLTSFYARHKAEVERRLDSFEREHPDIRVVRLRPGLIFKREAASGVRRLFAGPLLPSPLVAPARIHRRAGARPRGARHRSRRAPHTARAAARARGWEPQRSADEALRELLSGMAERAGASTPPLDPSNTGPLPSASSSPGSAARAASEPPPGAAWAARSPRAVLLEQTLPAGSP